MASRVLPRVSVPGSSGKVPAGTSGSAGVGVTIAPAFSCLYALVGRVVSPGSETEAFTWAASALIVGLAIGVASRELVALSGPKALERLQADYLLDPRAARNLLTFLSEQQAATGQARGLEEGTAVQPFRRAHGVLCLGGCEFHRAPPWAASSEARWMPARMRV